MQKALPHYLARALICGNHSHDLNRSLIYRMTSCKHQDTKISRSHLVHRTKDYACKFSRATFYNLPFPGLQQFHDLSVQQQRNDASNGRWSALMRSARDSGEDPVSNEKRHRRMKERARAINCMSFASGTLAFDKHGSNNIQRGSSQARCLSSNTTRTFTTGFWQKAEQSTNSRQMPCSGMWRWQYWQKVRLGEAKTPSRSVSDSSCKRKVEPFSDCKIRGLDKLETSCPSLSMACTTSNDQNTLVEPARSHTQYIQQEAESTNLVSSHTEPTRNCAEDPIPSDALQRGISDWDSMVVEPPRSWKDTWTPAKRNSQQNYSSTITDTRSRDNPSTVTTNVGDKHDPQAQPGDEELHALVALIAADLEECIEETGARGMKV